MNTRTTVAIALLFASLPAPTLAQTYRCTDGVSFVVWAGGGCEDLSYMSRDASSTAEGGTPAQNSSVLISSVSLDYSRTLRSWSLRGTVVNNGGSTANLNGVEVELYRLSNGREQRLNVVNVPFAPRLAPGASAEFFLAPIQRTR